VGSFWKYNPNLVRTDFQTRTIAPLPPPYIRSNKNEKIFKT